MSHLSGRHFLQIPGPTNVPDRVLWAMAQPTIDHRGPEFAKLTHQIMDGLKKILKTSETVVIYPSSGTGAWEAALVNTLSAGDKVLMFETGYFATLWRNMAVKLGLEVDFVPGDWRSGVDPAVVEEKLSEDKKHLIKAVMIGGFLVHGLQPGPMLFMNQPKLMYSIFIAMYLANIFMLFAGLGVAKVFSNFAKVRYSLIGPCIFLFAAIGSFGIRNDLMDLWIMLFFGVIGYFMNKYGYPLAPMIIDLVLGPLTEISLRRGLRMTDFQLAPFFFRPIAGGILIIALISILYGFLRKKPKVMEGEGEYVTD